jgi:hypothetical protein
VATVIKSPHLCTPCHPLPTVYYVPESSTFVWCCGVQEMRPVVWMQSFLAQHVNIAKRSLYLNYTQLHVRETQG